MIAALRAFPKPICGCPLRNHGSGVRVMVMAEISETSEPPEAPEGVKWVRWFWHHFTQEGEVIRRAPVAFAASVSAIGVLIYIAVQWRESEEIAIKDATIENQKTHIAILEEENKGMAPQQAAINIKRRHIIDALQSFYVEAGPLLNRAILKDTPIEVFNSYKSDVDKWGNKVADWISNNIGLPAKERFLDNANGMSLIYSLAYNNEHNNYINFLARSRRNLATLIENPAWDKPLPENN
jgi:hypothetical protein